MLAHEVALLVRPTTHLAANPKTNKHRPVNEPKRLLPNGEDPVFRPKEKPRKSKPALPNGERPNFGPEDPKKESAGSKGKLKGKLKKGKNPNTSGIKNGSEASKKSNNNINNNNNTTTTTTANTSANHTSRDTINQAFSARETGKKSGEESYAGSSFHSSPEALALPKPSFKSSPKQQTPVLDHQSPIQPVLQQNPTNNHNTTVSGNGHVGMNLHPGFVYQGMPAAPPPRYPVVAYPASGHYHPGFDYRNVPQGYGNYPYLPSGVPNGHLPPPQFVAPPQAHPMNQHFAPGVQRISFNDLMNSSK